MDRAHHENFSEPFQSLTSPPQARQRNSFDQLLTHLIGQTKPAQSLTPPRAEQPDPFAQGVWNNEIVGPVRAAPPIGPCRGSAKVDDTRRGKSLFDLLPSPRLTRRAGYPPPFTPVSRSDRGECRRARKCDGPISAVYCCGGRSSETACGWWSSPSSYRLNNAVVVARHSPRMIAALVFSMNQLGHAGGKPKPRMAQRPRRPCTSGGRVQNGAVRVKGWRYRIGPRICR